MDHAAGVFLKCERLEPEKVPLLGDVDINKTETGAVRLENVWIWRFANLTLELLPHVGDLVRLLFHCHLLFEPVLEALVVNKTDRAITLARVEQWICVSLLTTPAHLALDFTTVLIN